MLSALKSAKRMDLRNAIISNQVWMGQSSIKTAVIVVFDTYR